MPPVDPAARTVTSKEAHRNWKLVTDKALRGAAAIAAAPMEAEGKVGTRATFRKMGTRTVFRST